MGRQPCLVGYNACANPNSFASLQPSTTQAISGNLVLLQASSNNALSTVSTTCFLLSQLKRVLVKPLPGLAALQPCHTIKSAQQSCRCILPYALKICVKGFTTTAQHRQQHLHTAVSMLARQSISPKCPRGPITNINSALLVAIKSHYCVLRTLHAIDDGSHYTPSAPMSLPSG